MNWRRLNSTTTATYWQFLMNKRQLWIVALCGSVFVNLLLAGYIVGRETQAANPAFSLDPTFGFPRLLLRTLPEDRVSELMSSIEQERRELRTHYRKLRQAQSVWYEDFIAEPFDIEELTKSSTRYGTVYCEARENTDRVFLMLAEQLTPEERHQMVDSARHEWRRGESSSRNHQNSPTRERRE